MVDNVSPEILCEILSRTNVADWLHTLPYVCRDWRHVTSTPLLWRRVRGVKLSSVQSSECRISLFDGRHENVDLRGRAPSLTTFLLTKCQKRLEWLYVRDVADERLPTLLPTVDEFRFTNLTSLKFYGRAENSSEFFARLLNVSKRLRVITGEFLTTPVGMQIVELFAGLPELEHVTWIWIEPEHPKYVEEFLDCVSRFSITFRSLRMWCTVSNTVNGSRCRESLEAIVKSQKSIVSFGVNVCVKNAAGNKSAWLNANDFFAGLLDFRRTDNLILGNVDFSTNSVYRSFQQNVGIHLPLQDLRLLANCRGLDERFYDNWIVTLPSLTKLTLPWMHDDDVVVDVDAGAYVKSLTKFVARRCPNLEQLILTSSSASNDDVRNNNENAIGSDWSIFKRFVLNLHKAVHECHLAKKRNQFLLVIFQNCSIVDCTRNVMNDLKASNLCSVVVPCVEDRQFVIFRGCSHGRLQ